MVNVGFNLLLSDSANSAAEIATRPQVLTPVAFLEQGKLVLQFARRNAFDILRDLGRSQYWRARQHQVNVVATDMPPQNGHFSAHTHLSDDFSRSLSGFTAQDLVSVFRDPHKMVLDIVDRMCSLAIVGHL